MENASNRPTANVTATENHHLESYINYYKNLKNPEYAVLITGSWGSGKTHQITKLLNESEYIYISLFGSQSTEDIYSSVYAKMFPGKAFSKDLAGSTDGLTIGPIALGGMISKIAQAIIKDQVDPSKILIFDDLERSKLPINDLFGVFNKYVEHHQCRVIVLAHDKKLSDELTSTKEKVFGQTIEVIPQTSNAFDSFITNLPNEQIRLTLNNLRETILGIFEQSETYSLRILKHSIEDLSRLLSLLTESHRSHEEAVTTLVSLFLALSLEVRSGRLDAKSLEKRYDAIVTHQIRNREGTAPFPAIAIANNRYPTVDLSSNLLKDRDLVNLLIKGYYSKSEIQATLNESVYFSKSEDLPAWLAFINFDNISDKESKAAADKLIHQFNDRSLTEPGEILHLFSLRFLLSQMGLIKSSYDEVETDCNQYLDDLLQAQKIEPYMGTELMWGNEFIHGYNGYGYWIEDSYKANFERLVKHLEDTQLEAAKNKLPEQGKYLLSLISSNGDKFAQEVSLTFNGGNTFASIPALSGIEPSDFVQEWMGSQPSNWRDISRGLDNRYSSGQLFGTLKAEAQWLKSVIRLMDIEKKKADGIRKKRIERAIRPSLRNTANSL